MSEVAFMYSGGVDSTAGAVHLLERFRRVHLLTWDTGGGIIFLRWSRGPAGQLAERYPGRVVHHEGSCADLFDAVVKSRFAELYREYRSRFVWCLGCKVSMHIATIRYCKENGIETAGDGSAPDTPYYVEQMPVTLAWLEELFSRHGIEFVTPVFSLGSREEKVRMLDQAGLRRGRSLFGRNPGTQPLCLPGNLIYCLSTFLSIHPNFDPEQVHRFLITNEDLFEQMIRVADVPGRHSSS